LWTGRVVFALPLVFVLGFFAVFLIGGLSGVMVASVSLDLQVHDTYFVVAHLHYVLIGGAVFPLFGAFYYWFPKWTGRMLSTVGGWWNFALMFVGFNLAFFPMHLLGLNGMPRRVWTYTAQSGWANTNALATVGAGLLGVSVLIFVANVVVSLKRGRVAGPDPWHSGGIEWSTSSPPPPYNFRRLPVVRSRYPMWDEGNVREVTGLSTRKREVLVTRLHDAAPNHRYHMAGDSWWPPVMAFLSGATMLGLIFHPAWVPIGIGVLLCGLAGWFWHTHEPKPIPPVEGKPRGGFDVDTGTGGRR
jgi:cytochrome c oxidase subunit I+III